MQRYRARQPAKPRPVVGLLERAIASYKARPDALDLDPAQTRIVTLPDGRAVAVLRAPGGTEVAWYAHDARRVYRLKRRPDGLS